jgi:S-layer homology domain
MRVAAPPVANKDIDKEMVRRTSFRGALSVAQVSLIALGVIGIATPQAYAQSAPAPVTSATAAPNPFADVPQDSWAYQAIQGLAADGLITGYPDGTFKGDRPLTRYEAADLVERAVKAAEKKISAGQAVSDTDITALRELVDQFESEVKSVVANVADLKQTTAGIKAEADQTKKDLNDFEHKTKVGFLIISKDGTAATDVEATNRGSLTVAGAAPGHAIPGGQGVSPTGTLGGNTYLFNAGATDSAPLGPVHVGVSSTLARFLLGGDVDSHMSYGLRIATKIVSESPLGATSVSPSLCSNDTTTNCSFTDLNGGNGTLPLNLDYANVHYHSDGGVIVTVGRFANGSYGKYIYTGLQGLFGGGQTTGLELGYNQPRQGPLAMDFYYGQPSVSALTLDTQATTICSQNVVGFNLGTYRQGYGKLNPYCDGTPQQIGGWIRYYITKTRTAIGSTYDGYYNKTFTYWDPAAVACTVAGTARLAISASQCTSNAGTHVATATPGNYVTAQGDPSAVEAYIAEYFGPKDKPTFNVGLTFDHRLGFDPFTGANWFSANSIQTAFTYASKGNVYAGCCGNAFYSEYGAANSNVIQILYDRYGLNSVGGVEQTYQAATDFRNNTGFSNFNGMTLYSFEIGHWFTKSFRLAVGGIHLQNIPGLPIPIGTNGTVNTCAGCFVTSIKQNQLLVESYFTLY